MPDYSKAKIYQIKNHIDDDVYVGSTCVSLGRRLTKHRYAAKHDATVSLYDKFKELGAGSFYIELIEEYPCNSKHELLAREGFYIRERGTLNKSIAGRTSKQWYDEHKTEESSKNKQRYETNKEDKLAKNKEYREKNKELIAQRKKEYYENNKQKITEYKKKWSDDNHEHILEKAKKWRENNLDRSKETQRQYYEQNKQRISEREKAKREANKDKPVEKVTCECGLILHPRSMRLHLKSDRHAEHLHLKQKDNPQE